MEQNTCRNATVNFDFDMSTVRSDARSVLDGHMSCYQKLTGAIRVEGHCDERGTVDYNIALGQRRADSVKQYLVGHGVSASRVSTTSYGEERPVDRGHTEVAWAKNRRAEISASE
ncbi:MAG: OmpA family protein [Alphaproteobacteria bacterium]|nr:OmpA family protein [Alphaproteobacteria bacterium]MCB9696085.1 OmpA family protein [Alphaproteobacteria bacterium]